MKTKAIIIGIGILLGGITAAIAGDDKPIDFGQLPANAKIFIPEHFGDLKVSYAKVDSEIFDTAYEVVFVDGSKVEFDKRGNWREIDCEYGRVPEGALPAPILDFVKNNHAQRYVVSIDRDKRNYEVKLDNGLEIKFDLNFRVTGYDD